MKNSAQSLFLFVIIIAGLVIDQLLKTYILIKIPTSGIFIFENSFFSFQLSPTFNPGISFGLLIPSLLIIIISFLIIIGMIYYLFISKQKLYWLQKLSLGLILSGAIGNLADRFFREGVVDFISFNVFNFSWPSFNLADTLITIGGIILITSILKIDYSNGYEKNTTK